VDLSYHFSAGDRVMLADTCLLVGRDEGAARRFWSAISVWAVPAGGRTREGSPACIGGYSWRGASP